LSSNQNPLEDQSEFNKQIDLINEKAWELRYSDTREAIQLADQAGKLSEQIGYEYGHIAAGLNASVCAFLLGKNEDSVLVRLRTAHRYFEAQGDKHRLARTLNFLGNVYDSYGEYEKGLTFCLEGLKNAELVGYQEGIGDLLSTCGNIYSRLTDYSHALESYQQSLSIRVSLKEMKAAASSLNLIARTYTSLGDYENGLLFYTKSIRLREEQNDLGALPWNYLGLASLYEKKGEPERAMVYYSKSRAMNAQSKDKRLDLQCLIGIGRYLLLINDTRKGVAELEEALEVATTLNAKPLLYEIHALLALAYEMNRNTGEALRHYKLFHLLKEEVLNMESGNRLKNQQISFAVERSEQESEIYRLRNVELKSAYDEIEEKNKDITASINYASRIQQAILPRQDMLTEKLPQSFVFFCPKDIVSGDFYWFSEKNNKVIIAVADCTGHGVPGAFMSMLGVEKLNEALLLSDDVSEMLAHLNRSIKKSLGQCGKEGETRDGMDIALISLSRTSAGMILEYAGANRPLWMLEKDAGQICEAKATKVAIGGFTESDQYFTKHEFVLLPGDTVYLFSDGFADQFGGDTGKKLKTSKFKELLLAMRDKSVKEQRATLESSFLNWKGDLEQTDDVLVIGIRI
jgi:serine phosphatase RsbU (regulator of sigma subunit)